MRWGEVHSASMMKIGNDVIHWWAIIPGFLDGWGSLFDQVQFLIMCWWYWVTWLVGPRIFVTKTRLWNMLPGRFLALSWFASPTETSHPFCEMSWLSWTCTASAQNNQTAQVFGTETEQPLAFRWASQAHYVGYRNTWNYRWILPYCLWAGKLNTQWMLTLWIGHGPSHQYEQSSLYCSWCLFKGRWWIQLPVPHARWSWRWK
jgi:hypothetical protein